MSLLLTGAVLAAGAEPAPSVSPGIEEPSFDEQLRAAQQRHDEAQQRAAEARKKAAEARRKADQASRDAQQARAYEADMLARARAEAAERKAAERVQMTERERMEAEASAESARLDAELLEQSRPAEDRADIEQKAREVAEAAEADRKAMAEMREAEARRLAEKLRQAQERRAAAEAARNAKAMESPPVAAPSATPTAPIEQAQSIPPASSSRSEAAPLPPPAANAGLSQLPPVPAAAPETRVSVLILMRPGDRGIRRVDKSADPVLCLGPTCFISGGAGADARPVTRWQALGTLNTLGGRAGACSHSLGCVFRNVELGAVRASLQPIDLRLIRHDRREVHEVGPDGSCDVIAGRLSCSGGVTASDYRLWVVPESVARKAGVEALEAAVRSGLPQSRRVELTR